jgi:hypothetical protein
MDDVSRPWCQCANSGLAGLASLDVEPPISLIAESVFWRQSPGIDRRKAGVSCDSNDPGKAPITGSLGRFNTGTWLRPVFMSLCGSIPASCGWRAMDLRLCDIRAAR